MTGSSKNIVVIGAGINGLVAANYLRRAGHHVMLLERKDRVGGACVSETATVDGATQDYALGASTLGLMQDFVWQETGLAEALEIWAPTHPDLVFFPGDLQPTHLFDDAGHASEELAARWGEKGDVAAYFADEARVVKFLQDGYKAGRPPSIGDATAELGAELAALWISGSARNLLDHYFTAERTKVNAAMDVSESGPVSIDDPYSAFIMPMMSSGSVFGGSYGYVKGGIWQITRELGRINQALGVDVRISCAIRELDSQSGTVVFEGPTGSETVNADHIVFATDPMTAARLTDDGELLNTTSAERMLGTSGKLNLMFRKPVRWKNSPTDADTAFRYMFAMETIEDFEAATMAVVDGQDFVPGYYQVYCEGASMRRMGLAEPYDRLAVFFKNLGLARGGEELGHVEQQVKSIVLSYVANPEDCIWSRMLTPADLRQTFGFPGGNIEHTMLSFGQSYDQRQYAANDSQRFYQFGSVENMSICGSSTYPCGSVAGTPAYMCVTELLRHGI